MHPLPFVEPALINGAAHQLGQLGVIGGQGLGRKCQHIPGFLHVVHVAAHAGKTMQTATDLCLPGLYSGIVHLANTKFRNTRGVQRQHREQVRIQLWQIHYHLLIAQAIGALIIKTQLLSVAQSGLLTPGFFNIRWHILQANLGQQAGIIFLFLALGQCLALLDNLGSLLARK